MICSTVVSFGQNTFYFAHVVDGDAGGIWRTTIFLTNPAAAGGATASGAIMLTKDSPALQDAGTPMNATFINASNGQPSSGNTIPFQIAPGQTIKFTSTGGGPFAQGFATVSSNAPVGGSLVFSLYNAAGTQLVAEAGVPSASAVGRQAMFVDVGSGFDIGVAYANPGAAAANVRVALLNSDAQTVLSTTQTLGAGNHKAGFVNQLLGQPSIPPMVGTLQITSDNGLLSAIALRFAPTGVFTTLAPFSIASLFLEPMNALQRLLSSLHVFLV